MRRWLPAIVAVVFAGFAVPAVAVQAVGEGEVFAFSDVRITESSGLVDLGGVMVTVNDSGDVARVFTVDPDTGRTVGVTEFDADVVDVEALAPAGPASVWVGDLGDNEANRDEVRVYRVPVGPRAIEVDDPVTVTLRYPDRAHDAESLLAAPDGRLYVITKSFTGGRVFRTPPRPSGEVTLQEVARVPDYATDAALMEDGKQVIVRSLTQASLYTFPEFAVVARFPLPEQRQGEGVSVGPGDRVRLSSEGRNAPVLQIVVPPQAEPAPAPSPSPSVPPADVPADVPGPRSFGYDGTTVLGWAVAAIVALVAAGVAIGVRRRS